MLTIGTRKIIFPFIIWNACYLEYKIAWRRDILNSMKLQARIPGLPVKYNFSAVMDLL